jgi:hypothetical protein
MLKEVLTHSVNRLIVYQTTDCSAYVHLVVRVCHPKSP